MMAPHRTRHPHSPHHPQGHARNAAASKRPAGFVSFSANNTAILGPGEWTYGESPGVIETLLGSCICITLWHAGWRAGAACHYLLPEPPSAAGRGDPKYGSEALAMVLTQLRGKGIDPTVCEAKIFGGGRMFDLDAPDIGGRNAEFAEAALYKERIAVIARDTGRNGYRRLRFNLEDGAVWSRFDLSQPGMSASLGGTVNG